MNPIKLPLFCIALLIGLALTSFSVIPEKERSGRDNSIMSPLASNKMNGEDRASIYLHPNKRLLEDSVDIEKPIIGADISFVPQMKTSKFIRYFTIIMSIKNRVGFDSGANPTFV
ncbi:hypothetical protein [Cyclobacterium salsum]|uniref:hypothetical protein n=1 Tax=Cyclobacterium salsum TaxID=2666329 RepID=UPI0013911801|nr:hypothetical protein [Cyclobacterium salsum]